MRIHISESKKRGSSIPLSQLVRQRKENGGSSHLFPQNKVLQLHFPSLRHSKSTKTQPRTRGPQNLDSQIYKSKSALQKENSSLIPLCSRVHSRIRSREDTLRGPCRQGPFRDAAWDQAGARDREFAFWQLRDPGILPTRFLRNSCFDLSKTANFDIMIYFASFI